MNHPASPKSQHHGPCILAASSTFAMHVLFRLVQCSTTRSVLSHHRQAVPKHILPCIQPMPSSNPSLLSATSFVHVCSFLYVCRQLGSCMRFSRFPPPSTPFPPETENSTPDLYRHSERKPPKPPKQPGSSHPPSSPKSDGESSRRSSCSRRCSAGGKSSAPSRTSTVT